MALTFVTRTIRGVDQDVVVVDDTTDEIVISKSNLTSFDIKHLEKAEALIASDPAVTTLMEALQTYTMPNTSTAYAYYTPYLMNITEVNAAYLPRGINFDRTVWDQVQTNTTAIADHETRITTLEP